MIWWLVLLVLIQVTAAAILAYLVLSVVANLLGYKLFTEVPSGRNSVVECQPSKLNVGGSSPPGRFQKIIAEVKAIQSDVASSGPSLLKEASIHKRFNNLLAELEVLNKYDAQTP